MLDINRIDDIIQKNRDIHYEIKYKVDVVRHNVPLAIDPVEYIKEQFEKEGELIQYPIVDDNFGGFFVKKGETMFCFLNTYHPIVQQRYILAHEYYHFLNSRCEDKYFDGIFIDDMDDSLDERKADYFATLLLLDEDPVRQRFEHLKGLEFSFEEILCKLMNVFKVPYKMMSVRLLEIGLISNSELIRSTILDYADVKKMFDELGLDKLILERTGTTKFGNISLYLKMAKKEMFKDDYNNALQYYDDLLNKLANTNMNLIIYELEQTINKFSNNFNLVQQEKMREVLEDIKRGIS